MSKKDKYIDLTRRDLEKWAGDTILKRGKSYIRQVHDLCITKDGNLLAWVEGTDTYATFVKLSGTKKLDSLCACPYDDSPCKHAVAVVLAYQEKGKNKEDIPFVDNDDERLPLLAGMTDAFDEYADIKNWIKKEKNTDQSIRDYLKSMDKEKLEKWILDHVNDCASFRKSILDAMTLEKGDTEEIVRDTRREIRKLARMTPWWNHWKQEGEMPDYAPVEKRLEYLLKLNQADAAVSLGEDLVKYGLPQIESSDDEGQTADQIASCMDIVFQAIPKSSLSPVEQLLWVIESLMKDQWGLFDDAEAILEKGEYSIKDWSKVADTLLKRLEKIPIPVHDKNKDHVSFHERYRRDDLRKWAIYALEKAQRKGEILAILEREAPITLCYEDLVKRLIEVKEFEKAKQWALRGFNETIGNYRGIAENMMEYLETLAGRKRDYARCAALRSLSFFNSANKERFLDVKKMAEKAGVWNETREYLLYYLEKGDLPYKSLSNKESSFSQTGDDAHFKAPKTSKPPWVLPDPRIRFPRYYSRESFPVYNALIDIAILENRMKDVIKWHEESKKSRNPEGEKSEGVAEFIKDSYPDIALQIWRDLVDSLLSYSDVSNYHEAKRHLEKMKPVYEKENRQGEWRELLTQLRQQNKHRRRMIEVLDSLEGIRKKPKRKKIMDL
ncbi:SWIM zinc finger domain-containing protein [Candidatus Sumerlaeota bacterium]|nr:SWIM zinc finger domain-containing protein [Candidatus Sumerlaeota bacterium]